ncbi:L-glutamate gamma-semialdehyde dehydrogenase [Sphingomonas colocasiae]|uniref:L-glutamate gamma-semialdehyde dehydrogenase n=1 Tax=Sphingomonas colocasiae TaxID=1848973 RepID=A0ABS7PLH3_9SPHN|nr:L-glutamate gamma-semialdehyde dehydrogenase [Sphingomonas colocasiae]MBY8822076.1 L-glutamate gamma-semialdehyde dehydrogenase [Sphingomonas colocasiae]
MFAISPSIDVRNEPVRGYAPGSPERDSLRAALAAMAGDRIELPLVIGGKPVTTGRLEAAISPHDHAHVLADAHLAGADEVGQAIAAAKAAWHDWSRTPWEARARIFLKAADLVSGPWRDRLNAATMLGQSKTAPQAEIDSAAELADYFRFNVSFMLRIYGEQPLSSEGVWNRLDYRPLEGFIYAITPFNFTAIAGNLPAAPALMGNVVVWKPSATAKYSAHFVMALLREAGLPDGVINLIYGDAAATSAQILADPELAGIHFTGSTGVFDAILRDVAGRKYRNYPRIVGETGGKNFTLAHPSADIAALATAIIRGGYEYQGQKCSATSRVYAPRSLWPALRDRLVADIETIRVGDVADFTNFMGAVIDEKSWHKQAAAREAAERSASETLIAGGVPDMRVGYFVPPTLIETSDPASRFMTEEFFGPIVTAFVYEDDAFEAMLDTIDKGSAYGLTGSIFARDAGAIATALDRLRHTAGNVYVNDKSAGAVVGQQPFGGARASGTNDKAGSMWNLARWISPRTIKENFAPPTDYRYPAMRADRG